MMGISLLPAGGIINPASISGLQLWIDSETGVTGTDDGPIDAITDRSGAGNNMSTVVTNRPVWRTAQFKSATKHSIDTSDALPNYLTCTDFSFNGSVSFWGVFQWTSTNTVQTTAPNPPLCFWSDSVGSSFRYVGFSAGQPQFAFPTDGINYDTFSSSRTDLNDGNPHSICWTHNSDGTLTCYVDGIATDVWTGIWTAGEVTHVSTLALGYTSTDPYIGHFAETMIYNSALTASQVQSLHIRAKGLWF